MARYGTLDGPHLYLRVNAISSRTSHETEHRLLQVRASLHSHEVIDADDFAVIIVLYHRSLLTQQESRLVILAEKLKSYSGARQFLICYTAAVSQHDLNFLSQKLFDSTRGLLLHCDLMFARSLESAETRPKPISARLRQHNRPEVRVRPFDSCIAVGYATVCLNQYLALLKATCRRDQTVRLVIDSIVAGNVEQSATAYPG